MICSTNLGNWETDGPVDCNRAPMKRSHFCGQDELNPHFDNNLMVIILRKL